MRKRLTIRVHHWLEDRFPEKRLFLRSDTDTRFIRLRPGAQLIAWTGSIALVGWTIIATAIVLMDTIGAGNYRAQAEQQRVLYERRLTAMAAERETRAAEAAAAHARFSSVLEQVSAMQSELLASEDRRRELETGIEVLQATLRDVITQRDTALAAVSAAPATSPEGAAVPANTTAIAGTLATLADQLTDTAQERDALALDAALARAETDDLLLEIRLLQERNDQIFRQLEEAMLVSVEPIEGMFRAAGMNPDALIETVRNAYSGQGGPLTPIQFSTMGGAPDPDTMRVNGILEGLDRINLYRITAERLPFSMPVFSSFRYTSGFGPRWGRMHNGTDFAAPVGTDIHAAGDGVVTFAGWSGGYGRLIKIRHDNGVETRYAHLSQIRVSVGERVSRGELIGDMGNSGRSTGSHLHYEIRVNGQAVDPMIFIRAGRNVF